MNNDPFWIVILALSSGLVGSILALVGGYFVQRALSDREQKRNSQKRCFIQVLEISHIIGACYAYREFGKGMARIFFEKQVESVREKLKKGSDEFEISHAMCAFIAEGLSKYVETASNTQLLQITAFMNAFKTIFEKAVDFKVSDDLLMDLPNEVVVEHSFYRLNSVRFFQSLNLWFDFVESTRNGFLNAKELFSQWITLTQIFDSADKLLKTLIAKGDMDPKQSKELLSRTYREVVEKLYAGITDQFKIEKAQKYISEKPWEDNSRI